MADVARASAAFGIASSLSLPITSDGEVVGGVNLYAATEDAFAGLYEEVASAIGSDAEQAVTNANLSFQTLRAALETPARLQERSDINVALGMTSAAQGIQHPGARERLRNAAARAGVTELRAAKVIRHIRPAWGAQGRGRAQPWGAQIWYLRHRESTVASTVDVEAA